MAGLITAHSNSFFFQRGELALKLAENLRQEQTGYWRHKFDQLSQSQPSFFWYCGVVKGKIIYSGSELWSPTILIYLLQRYNTNLRKGDPQKRLATLKQLIAGQSTTPLELAHQLQQENVATADQIKQSLHTKILNDFDQYFDFSDGQAEFINDPNLTEILALDIQNILSQVDLRNNQWQQIKTLIPSLDLIPVLNPKPAADYQQLSAAKYLQLSELLRDGSNVNKIAIKLAKDNLEVARMLSKLVQAGVVVLKKPRSTSPPKVLVVDDSPLMLKQFQHWLKSLNYPIVTCQDALKAVDLIKETRPDVIFIDINMPIVSGFELVKMIRSVSAIANIPIIILTGEQKLSNKWRAQWGGCDFLTKPITADEQRNFAKNLQVLIEKTLENSDNSLEKSLP